MKVDEEEVKFPGTNFEEVIDVIQVTNLETMKNYFSANIFLSGQISFVSKIIMS